MYFLGSFLDIKHGLLVADLSPAIARLSIRGEALEEGTVKQEERHKSHDLWPAGSGKDGGYLPGWCLKSMKTYHCLVVFLINTLKNI